MKNIFCALVFCLAIGLANPGCSKKTPTNSIPLTDYEAMRLRIANEVGQGAIKLDASGMADLPEADRSASTDGKIYASNDANKGWLVAFNLTFGRTVTQQFLLYVEKSTPASNESLTVGPLKLSVTGKAEQAHWYNAATQ